MAGDIASLCLIVHGARCCLPSWQPPSQRWRSSTFIGVWQTEPTLYAVLCAVWQPDARAPGFWAEAAAVRARLNCANTNRT